MSKYLHGEARRWAKAENDSLSRFIRMAVIERIIRLKSQKPRGK